MQTITRIYITRGDNLYNEDGARCDKAVALEFNKKLYWANYSFATLRELSYHLECYGIHLDHSTGQWGMWEVDEYTGERGATLNKRITKIGKHHDDVFSANSSYMKRSVMDENGNCFWDVFDLKQQLQAEEGA